MHNIFTFLNLGSFSLQIITILDRLLHHSVIININGKSYRTHQALKENGIELSE